jgi:hypothetical protein
MRFLRPAVSIPQTENIRSTKACDAGAETRSSAIGASHGYVARRSLQNFRQSVIDVGLLFLMSMRYLDSSDCALSVDDGAGSVARCLAARNLNFDGGSAVSASADSETPVV